VTWPTIDIGVRYYGSCVYSCLQCKVLFTLRTAPYFDACTCTHGDVHQAGLDLGGVLHLLLYGNSVCVNAAIEINMLHYGVIVCSVNGV